MTDIKIALTHRMARIDGAEVGGEFIPLTVLIAAGGRHGTKEATTGQEEALMAAGLAYIAQDGSLCLTGAGLRFEVALIESIPPRTWERITYDWQATRQTVILEDPWEDHAGITGAEAGTDGQGGWLHTVPADARIITRQPVTREYFTGRGPERARCSHDRTDLEECAECVAQVEAAARQTAAMGKKPGA